MNAGQSIENTFKPYEVTGNNLAMYEYKNQDLFERTEANLQKASISMRDMNLETAITNDAKISALQGVPSAVTIAPTSAFHQPVNQPPSDNNNTTASTQVTTQNSSNERDGGMFSPTNS